MSGRSDRQSTLRVWEVDWAVPASEGGTPWAAYDWALEQAAALEQPVVTIVGATYESLGRLDLAIGREEASSLRIQPHGYRASGIAVRGVTTRGFWVCRGVTLVAWANDEVMAEVESQKPAAVAAVATWPDSIPSWLSVYSPQRIGQSRPDQEGEYAVTEPLDVTAIQADALGVLKTVNENHSALGVDEKHLVARALLELRRNETLPSNASLERYLMALGWNGSLIARTLKLADDVRDGKNPRTS